MSVGWLPAKMLQAGMTLVNRDNEQTLKVVSQTKLNKTDTVYNFEVDEFHTYHIGEFGVWVHNNCNPDFINNIIKSQKIAPDLLVKGVHFNIGSVELKALPDNKGGVIFKPVFSSTSSSAANKAISQANNAIESKAFRDFLLKHVNAGFDMAKQNGSSKALEFKMLKIALERMQ